MGAAACLVWCRNARIWEIRSNRISCCLAEKSYVCDSRSRTTCYIGTPCCRVLVIRGRSRLCQGLLACILIDEPMQVACPTSPDDSRSRLSSRANTFLFFQRREDPWKICNEIQDNERHRSEDIRNLSLSN